MAGAPVCNRPYPRHYTGFHPATVGLPTLQIGVPSGWSCKGLAARAGRMTCIMIGPRRKNTAGAEGSPARLARIRVATPGCHGQNSARSARGGA